VTETEVTADLLRRVAALGDRIASFADENEQTRRLAPELVAELSAAGVFRMVVPKEIGGLETDAATLIRVIEAVAKADGAAGWCVMIGASTGVTSAYLPKRAAEEIYGDPVAVTGGVFVPNGRAVRVEGGYRVSGRWPFASGSQHCSWLQLGSVVFGADGPERLADGSINARSMVLPAGEVEILDTWSSAGLRGTGSHDVSATDVFVPSKHSLSLTADEPWANGPLYRFPVFGLLALGIAGVALGIARASVESLKDLAGTKKPTGSRRALAERSATQQELAEAEAELRSVRAFLFEAVDDAWQAAAAGAEISLEQRAVLRLAATHATRSSADVVDAMYDLGGATSVYTSSLLQRQFRDIHVATQHLMVAPPTYELVGRVLLGLQADTGSL
jgi:alkylation response protein AidB-like acyl-CoA dehydrogenase